MDESVPIIPTIPTIPTITTNVIKKTEFHDSWPIGDDAPLIEFHVDQSGSTHSSRDQPEARHYCPEPGCKASFKRKYDIDRHYQAKHTQSKNIFCPVDGCKYSLEPDLTSMRFGYSLPWDLLHGLLKVKVLAQDEENGYKRLLLYGFHRKDKLLKHLAKHHKDVAIELVCPTGAKDACLADPVLAETQKFCARGNYGEACTILGRFQRKDGSWIDWSGADRDIVAAMGFKPWVNPKTSKASEVSNISYETYQPSPGSVGASAQGSGSGSTPNAGDEMMQLSQGQINQPVAAKSPYGSFPDSSIGQFNTNNHSQSLWRPTQQLSQTDLFPGHGHVNNWMANSNEFMPTVSTGLNVPMGLPDFKNFSTEFMASVTTSQPNDNIAGTLANMVDFNNVSVGGISEDLCMPFDGAYASAETGQTMSENFNAGNSESWDSLFDLGSDADAATWDFDNGN